MKNLQGNWIVSEPSTSVTPMKCVQWGLIAGLVGTMAMDLTLVGGLEALGLPIDTCFLTIGRTAMQFFSILGIRFSGEVTLGVAVYHLLGPLLGAVYGLIVSQVSALQRTTLKKSLLYAVLYAEVVSQLILTMVPVLLRMPTQEAMLWFAGSSVLHAIWGAVMGLAAYYLVWFSTPKYGNLRTEGTGGITWKIM
jgi:hypothetical protein